jgi:endonuclease/exonuclease/phosphatase family metal-dependent hydrolase
MTYNIHHGEGMDGRIDLPRIAEIIRKLNPDVVALQEVDDKTQRSGGIAQAEVLGELTSMHAAFGKALPFQGGGYGLGLLSREPFQDLVTYHLPSSADRENRAALAAVIQPSPLHPPLTFVTTHLDHTRDDTDRRQQVLRLNEIFAQPDSPQTILMGDLNATPESAALGPIWAQWLDAAGVDGAPTIPVDNPTRRIDYILLRPGGRWRSLNCWVLDERMASDHLPVIADIEVW